MIIGMYLNRLIFLDDRQFRAFPSKSAPLIKKIAIKYRDNIVHYRYFRGNIRMLEKGQVHLSSGVCVELATLVGYPFLPLQLQPLVSSFYYWNMLTYRSTNRLISISIRLRSLNLYLGISAVIVSPPRCRVNHMVR